MRMIKAIKSVRYRKIIFVSIFFFLVIALQFRYFILKDFTTLSALMFIGSASVAIATMIKPLFGLYVIIIMITIAGGRGLLRFGDFWAQASEIVCLIVATMWLIRGLFRGKVFIGFNGIRKFMIIFMLTLIPGGVKGYFSGNGLMYVIFEMSLYLRFIIVGILVYNIIESQESFRKALTLFLVCGFVVSANALLVYYFSFGESALLPEPVFGGYGRVASTFGNPNSFAGFLEIYIPISVSLYFFYTKLHHRLMILVSILVSTWALFLTYSRGGFLALLISLIILVIFSPIRARYKSFSLMLLIAILSVVVFSSAQMRQKSVFTGFSVREELEYGRRGEQYKEYLSIFYRHPIIGIGFGYRQEGYAFYPQKDGEFTLSGLNSYYLDILTKGGILAFSGLLFLLAAIFKNISRGLREKEKLIYFTSLGLISGLAGHLMHQLMDNLLKWPAGGMIFWFLIGLNLAGIKIATSCNYSSCKD